MTQEAHRGRNPQPTEKPAGLLQTASRSLFWNATLLPLVSAASLASAVYLRRSLELESAPYDIGIGLVAALLVYSGFGLSESVRQFVPEVRLREGSPGVARLLRRVWSARLLLLLAILVPINLFAPEIAERFQLGGAGTLLVRLMSALALIRAVVELGVRSLQAHLAHLAANLVQVAQTFGQALAIVIALWLGGGVPGIFAGLVVSGGVVATLALWATAHTVRAAGPRAQALTPAEATEPGPTGAPRAGGGIARKRLWRFASFMYVYDLTNMFSMPAFASPALAAVVSDVGQVALFNTAFQIPMMVVVLVLNAFQGLYRPVFATVLAERDLDRLRTTFREISKVQLVLLVPAGAGLLVVLGDLVPLLFGPAFAPAVPLARILCAFLFLESIFNLGIIVLSTDHRYRSVLWAQSLRFICAPAFVLLAGAGYLTAATWVFAAGRLAAILGAFVAARRRYELRFPWRFALRVIVPAALMTAAVAAGRMAGDPSWTRTLLLSGAGAALFALLARWSRILGAREADLLGRAGFPGARLLLRWLVPGGPGSNERIDGR